jgi:hypothetical protein
MTQIWSTRQQHSTLVQLKTIGLLKLSRLCLLARVPRWLFLHATACLTAVAVFVAYGNMVKSTKHAQGSESYNYEYQYRQLASTLVFERNDIAFTFANGTILMLNNETTLHPRSEVQLTTLVEDAIWTFSCKRERWTDTPKGNTGTPWIQHDGTDWLLVLGDKTSRLQYPVSALLLTQAGAWLIWYNKLWYMSDSHLRLVSQQNTTLYKSEDTWRFTNESWPLYGKECFDDRPESYFLNEAHVVRVSPVSIATLMLRRIVFMTYYTLDYYRIPGNIPSRVPHHCRRPYRLQCLQRSHLRSSAFDILSSFHRLSSILHSR